MAPGEILRAFSSFIQDHDISPAWREKKEEAWTKNKWFVPDNVNQALDIWKAALSDENIDNWVGSLPMVNQGKTVGIIMAGNIPLVGMHDLFSCLVSGYRVKMKMSSDDDVLPAFWIEGASGYLPDLAGSIEKAENLRNVDMAIATGSNNTSRYFEYYFRDIPHLLRKNRNSVAVLDGSETPEQLRALGRDVFDYFGLGCRNVTHLFLPENYSFKPLFDAWEEHLELLNHNKYANNYHYHKALLLMNLDPHMDTGYVLLKHNENIYSPVGMLNYSFYRNLSEVTEKLHTAADEIQCVVSAVSEIRGILPGEAQNTMLWDYADGVDTLAWLANNAQNLP